MPRENDQESCFFYPDAAKPLQQEVADFDPQFFLILDNPVKDGDRVIGELEEFEWKCFVWAEYAFSLMAGVPNAEQFQRIIDDEAAAKRYLAESKILRTKAKKAMGWFLNSIFKRAEALFKGIEDYEQYGLFVRDGRILVLRADKDAEYERMVERIKKGYSSTSLQRTDTVN